MRSMVEQSRRNSERIGNKRNALNSCVAANSPEIHPISIPSNISFSTSYNTSHTSNNASNNISNKTSQYALNTVNSTSQNTSQNVSQLSQYTPITQYASTDNDSILSSPIITTQNKEKNINPEYYNIHTKKMSDTNNSNNIKDINNINNATNTDKTTHSSFDSKCGDGSFQTLDHMAYDDEKEECSFCETVSFLTIFSGGKKKHVYQRP